MIEDAELLRRYVAEHSQEAFSELVRRHVNLVYSVALRRLSGDTHLAEDATQNVFVDLARKASSLQNRPVLSGWLHRSARYAAGNLVRTERRRRAREQENYAMQDQLTAAEIAPAWDRLRPLLDETMSELNEHDRDAVALRFFEGRAFADVARILKLTEDTARKRVERALDKMTALLARRGVTSTTAAVGMALTSQGALAAPSGLASSVAGSALAAAAAGGATGGLGVLATFLSSKALVGAGIATAAAVAVAVYENGEAHRRTRELDLATRERASLLGSVADLDRRLRVAEQRVTAAEQDNSELLAAVQQHLARNPRAAGSGTDAARLQTSDTELTEQGVRDRYQRAQKLAREGDPEEALRELLWCFDEGMVRFSSYSGVRGSFLVSDIVRLGQRYPAALAALRERRDRAEKRMFLSAGEYQATSEVSAINRGLNESARTIELMDQLPAGDRRRATLANGAFEELIARQRYEDAVAGRSFTSMQSLFESSVTEVPALAGLPNADSIRRSRLKSAVAMAAKNIEALVGSGRREEAGVLARQVLSHDSSDATRALLTAHATRAGAPALLAQTTGK